MIAATDIKDRESLQQWLVEWPKSQGMDEEAACKVAVSIATNFYAGFTVGSCEISFEIF